MFSPDPYAPPHALASGHNVDSPLLLDPASHPDAILPNLEDLLGLQSATGGTVPSHKRLCICTQKYFFGRNCGKARSLAGAKEEGRHSGLGDVVSVNVCVTCGLTRDAVSARLQRARGTGCSVFISDTLCEDGKKR